MSERLQIPVEPLSERRWQDVRSAVLDRARELPLRSEDRDSPRYEGTARTRSWARRASPAIALVAVAAAILLAVTHGDTPRVAETSRVVTDAAAASASAGDVTLQLAAHTSVLVVELGPEQWLVSIEYGRVRFLVPPRGERPSFSVDAGRTRVVVIGTTFSVAREPGAPSGDVVVEHGTVRVEDLAEQHVLHDGDRWPLLSAERSSDAHSPATAAPATRSEAATAEARADTTSPRAPRPLSSAGGTPSGRTDEPTSEPAMPVDLGSPPPTVASADAVTATEIADATPASESDRYREAEALERSDPARALELYAALVAEGGRWGAPALMAQARLEYEQHHHAQARASCQRYLSEHPDGINAEDARELLGRMR